MQGKGTFDVKNDLRVATHTLIDRGCDASYVEAIDQKEVSTLGDGVGGGGDFIQDGWRPRDLTIQKHNDFAFLILATDPGDGATLVVPAGEYYVETSAPAYHVNEHQLRLADVTNAKFYLTAIRGTSEFAANPNAWADSTGFYMEVARSTQTRAFCDGRFTVTRTTALELQHRCTTSKGKDGFGVETGFYGSFYTTMVPADSVYGHVKMWQVRQDEELQGFYIGHTFLTDPVPPPIGPISAYSVDVLDDTVDGRLATPGNADFNIPNAGTTAFSISCWSKRTSGNTASQTLVGFGRSAAWSQNQITLGHLSFTGEPYCSVFADASSGSKNYTSSVLPDLEDWFMMTITFDGTNGANAFKLYMNDAWDTLVTKGVDNDISGMTQIDMPGSIGTDATGGGGADSTIFSVTTWDSELSAAEVAAAYNSGDATTFDALTDSGDYTSSSSVVSLWLTGKADSPNLGTDYGPNGLDLSSETGNITRVAEVPDGT